MKNLKRKESIIAGLDIGNMEVRAVIGQVFESSIDIIGVGQAHSNGLRKGIVVNIDDTTKAIHEAIEAAELMAGTGVSTVYVGISGSHINSFDSRGMVAIQGKEIRSIDIQRVMDASQAVSVPSDRNVIHIVSKGFKVDDQEGISDPIGMSGIRLESSVHIVTANRTALQNVLKCCQKAGLKVESLASNTLASANFLLTRDEQNLGVGLVDIGGETTNVILYAKGELAFTTVLPIGANSITNDIAIVLKTPPLEAEKLKCQFGCAMPNLVMEGEKLDVMSVGNRPKQSIQRRYLCEIIEPRVEEILHLIQNRIQKTSFAPQLSSGIVLTGGGSQLDGLIEMGEFLLDMPVRKGHLQNIGGLKETVSCPSFTMGIGLLLYGLEERDKRNSKTQPNLTQWLKKISSAFKGAF